MSDTVTATPSSEKTLATLAGISRRLGVTVKQLTPFIAEAQVSPVKSENNETLYDVNDVVRMLESLSKKDKARFESLQKPQNYSPALYKKKFEALKSWMPSKPEPSSEARPVKKQARTSASTDWKGVDSKHITEEDLALLSGFQNPLTAKQVSHSLRVPLKQASEAIYGSGLPTAQLKNILVVDLPKNRLGSFVAELPDGLREKVLLAQRNRGSGISRQRLSDLLHLPPAAVERFLKALPGSPQSLTIEALDYVKTLPQYGTLLAGLDAELDKERAESTKSRKRRKRSQKGGTVSILEVAERYNITEENAVLLGKRRFFPRYNPTEGTVHEASKHIPEHFVYEMIDDNCYTLYSMAKEFKVTPQSLERALLKSKIKPLRSYLLQYGKISHKVILYSERTAERFRRSENYLTLQQEQDAIREAQNNSSRRMSEVEEAELQTYLQEIESRVVVDARERSFSPKKAVFYVGPTNSGKTYNSLNELFDEYEKNERRGLYVYAGPLRMLAFEVYEKMVDRYGEENVGFLTGEEQINPTANMLACTVEMAPDEGTSLVLDESHWIVDPNRGQHWTHLLMAGKYTNMHILTAKEALETLKSLVSDSENISAREFERRTPIMYAGEISLKEIPSRTAVVAFSRRTVYAIAGDLARAGKKVGVLYGAMPLKVRKAQIEKYVEGVYDIMVTTDVIGHGINLPIDNVVFAQTEKFDGRERREIYVWEAAQIAGRAGRYGLSVSGNVYGLTGKSWFSKNNELMRAGTLAAGGLTETDLVANEALLFPRFGDLNVNNATELPQAVVAWQQKAYALMQDRPVIPSDLSIEYKLFERVAETAGIPQHKPEREFNGMPANTVWQLMSGPFNAKGNVISSAARWLLEDDPEKSDTLEKYFDRLVIPVAQVMKSGKGLHKDQVGLFETISGEIGELKMIHVMFGGAGTLRLSELIEYEDIIDSLLIRSLSAAIKSSQYGRCEKCRKNCSPWFSMCDRCSFEKSWW